MERIDRILKHNLFIECVRRNGEAEKDRVFCRHDMGHFLDVARIAMILNLEKALHIEKELIYGAALLHDIGRYLQYEQGIPHEEASAELAPRILSDCGFDEQEADAVLKAIRNHRTKEIAEEASLSGILYLADKASRACFACKVSDDCNWKNDKKNNTIKI